VANSENKTVRPNKLLSVVVPCHNEEEVLPSTHKHITSVLSQLIVSKRCQTYEIVYVNNGSTDQTQKVLKDLFDHDSHVRILALRRDLVFRDQFPLDFIMPREIWW
jgi:glycosyltransferase involved in cell wall biosynthesis